MKKFLCIFMALTMVLSLAACGKQIDDNPPDNDTLNPGVSDTNDPNGEDVSDTPVENEWTYDFDSAFIEENGIEYIWDQLDEKIRINLGEIMNAIRNVEIYCSFSQGLHKDEFQEFMQFVSNCTTAYVYEGKRFKAHIGEDDIVTGVTLTYNVDYEADAVNMTNTLNAQLDSVTASIPDVSDYEKIKYLYETLILFCDYSEDAVSPFTSYGALVEGRATCQGYADAMHLLLSRAGFTTCFATGIGDDPNVTHKWNYVLVDDKWYIIDPTWGDPKDKGDRDYICYDYLMISEEVLLADHQETHDSPYFDLPVADSMDLNYHIMSGYYAENYDQLIEIIEKQTLECAKNGEKYIYVRCADAELFNEANERLFSGDYEMQDIIINAKEETGANLVTKSWQKLIKEGQNAITITLKYED